MGNCSLCDFMALSALLEGFKRKLARNASSCWMHWYVCVLMEHLMRLWCLWWKIRLIFTVGIDSTIASIPRYYTSILQNWLQIKHTNNSFFLYLEKHIVHMCYNLIVQTIKGVAWPFSSVRKITAGTWGPVRGQGCGGGGSPRKLLDFRGFEFFRVDNILTLCGEHSFFVLPF